MGTRMIRMRGAVALASGFAAALSVIVSGQAQQSPQQRAAPIFIDGQAQIVPEFQDQAEWIRHALWVETEFDSDNDRTRADISERISTCCTTSSTAATRSVALSAMRSIAASKPAANLSVYLVQLPWSGTTINTTNLITRGWADPQNAASLKRGGDYHSLDRSKPLEPGRFVDLTFDLQPDDQIVPAGKRIGLMILSSDRDFTLWPKPGTELTVDLDATSIQIPIVGGAAAYRRATQSR